MTSNTPKAAHLTARLKSLSPAKKETVLLKALANGPQWRIDATLAAISPDEWNRDEITRLQTCAKRVDTIKIMETAAALGHLSAVKSVAEIIGYKNLGEYACYPGVLAAFNAAILNDNYAIADYCRALGAHPSRTFVFQSAIYSAFEEKNLDKLDYLFSAGANPNDYLDYAVTEYLSNNQPSDSVKLIDTLIAYGADTTNSQTARTAMYYAVRSGNAYLIGSMLDMGFRPDATDITNADKPVIRKMLEAALKKPAPQKTPRP